MDFSIVNEQTQMLIALDMAMVLQLMGLWVAVVIDKYIHTEVRRILFAIIGVVLSLIVVSHISAIFDEMNIGGFPATLMAVYGYAMRPVVIVLFIRIMAYKRKSWFLWVILIVNALIHMSAFFSGVCFRLDENGEFTREPLGYTSFVVSALLILYMVYVGFRDFYKNHKQDMVFPIFVSGIIVVAVIADMKTSFGATVTFLMVSMVSACVFYYIWMHQKFVAEHEKAMETGQRVQIMMSQIQPHFLFNTLSTVQALCRIDPEKASKTLESFGIYLRQNINSLDQPDLIPFEKEMEHVRIYVSIEEIRFPSIEVTYDLKDVDFEIPALTVQPLVENAIRHGVRIRDHGKIHVETKRSSRHHVIIISDNGKGFDPSAVDHENETHIGLRNVKERVQTMCFGTMDINSVIDKGTRITIKIPIEEGEAVS